MTIQSTDFREVGEDFVKHFGKKGMHWGVRKSESGTSNISSEPKQGMSKKKKVAIGVGGAFLVAGIAATAYMMSKNGKGNEPIISIRKARAYVPVPKPKIPYSWDKPRPPHINKTKIVDGFNKSIWDTQVKDFDRMIAESHSEQTIYMRKTMREAGGQYVVQDNPYTPQARK